MIRLFRVFIPVTVLALLVTDAVLVFLSYLLAAYLVLGRDYDILNYLTEEGGFLRIALNSTVILLAIYFNDLYTNIRIRSRIQLVQQVCFVIGIAFLAQALTGYVKRDLMLPKWVAIEGNILVMVCLLSSRILFSTLLWRAVGSERILFLGSSPIIFQLASHLAKNPHLGFLPIGYLSESESEGDTADAAPEDGPTIPRLGLVGDLKKVVEAQHPGKIVVAMKERRLRLPVIDLLDLRFSGILAEEIASLYELATGRVCTQEIRPSQLVFSSAVGPLQRRSLRLQSLYSFLVALVGLTVTAPVLALVAILVKITSPGPALIRQTRVGFRNRPFTLYKFRSMYQDAEARTGAVWAKRNDARITPLGYWLRALRLDELPQLFNVIRGEMSIVGPRPERPEFVSAFAEKIPYYRQRHSVLPGITGWAQVNYKYGDTIEDTMIKLEYDLYYIKHISLSLDLYIMFHTLKTMLLFRGAQ